METEVFYAGNLEEEALQGLLTEATFLQSGLFLGESIPPHVITTEMRRDLLYFAPYNSEIPFTSYASGRIFDRDFELRWEKRGATWQVVYIGAERVLPPPLTRQEDEERTLQTRRIKYYYLFGKRLHTEQIRGLEDKKNRFAEVRIPRLLHYPVSEAEKNSERACLVVYEYLNQAGQVRAFRFVKLKGTEE